jgi:hypothetical protein
MSAEADKPPKAGVYVLRHRQTEVDFYIGASLNVSDRLAQHARPGSAFLKAVAVPWAEIEPVVISLPKATPAMLSAIEVLLIDGVGRTVEPGGSLVNRAGGADRRRLWASGQLRIGREGIAAEGADGLSGASAGGCRRRFRAEAQRPGSATKAALILRTE